MEMNMEKRTIACLDRVMQEVRTAELTQQIKLPDGMPDIGRMLAAWGQPILRGKEWEDGEASASGGMMVWILYAPEDGGKPCCLDGWIPFRLKWELPEEIPEGTLRIRCLTRFVDGRSVSPRKIMVRCGISALGEADVPGERELAVPVGEAENVELLPNAYPLRIPKEAGEKAFLLDEDLTLPDSAPQPEKVIYSRMEPRITTAGFWETSWPSGETEICMCSMPVKKGSSTAGIFRCPSLRSRSFSRSTAPMLWGIWRPR